MESRKTSPRPQHHPLEKTTVPPNHHRVKRKTQNPFAATVHAPNHGKIRSATDLTTHPFEPQHQDRHREVPLGERNKGQKAAGNSRPRPITLAPDPSHSRTLASDSPNRTSPLGIGLVRNPFVTQRWSPFALNLSRKRPLVTKRRPPLGGGPRRRLFMGRCPTWTRSLGGVATPSQQRPRHAPASLPAPKTLLGSGRACSEGTNPRS